MSIEIGEFELRQPAEPAPDRTPPPAEESAQEAASAPALSPESLRRALEHQLRIWAH